MSADVVMDQDCDLFCSLLGKVYFLHFGFSLFLRMDYGYGHWNIIILI